MGEMGMSPADVMAMTNNAEGGFGGGMGLWGFLMVAIIFGGGGLFGNRGEAAGLAQGALTRQDINDAVGTQTITNKLDGISNGLCDSTFALNNTMNNGFNNLGNNMTTGMFAIQKEISDCCCETNRNIDATRFAAERGFCDVITNANNNTRDLLANQIANTQRIVDMLNTQEIQKLRDDTITLKTQLSQQAQTANIVSQLNPIPHPSFLVANPNCPPPVYC